LRRLASICAAVAMDAGSCEVHSETRSGKLKVCTACLVLFTCMIWLARNRVAVTFADLSFFLPSAFGRDGRIGCIERCGAS